MSSNTMDQKEPTDLEVKQKFDALDRDQRFQLLSLSTQHAPETQKLQLQLGVSQERLDRLLQLESGALAHLEQLDRTNPEIHQFVRGVQMREFVKQEAGAEAVWATHKVMIPRGCSAIEAVWLDLGEEYPQHPRIIARVLGRVRFLFGTVPQLEYTGWDLFMHGHKPETKGGCLRLPMPPLPIPALDFHSIELEVQLPLEWPTPSLIAETLHFSNPVHNELGRWRINTQFQAILSASAWHEDRGKISRFPFPSCRLISRVAVLFKTGDDQILETAPFQAMDLLVDGAPRMLATSPGAWSLRSSNKGVYCLEFGNQPESLDSGSKIWEIAHRLPPWWEAQKYTPTQEQKDNLNHTLEYADMKFPPLPEFSKLQPLQMQTGLLFVGDSNVELRITWCPGAPKRIQTHISIVHCPYQVLVGGIGGLSNTPFDRVGLD